MRKTNERNGNGNNRCFSRISDLELLRMLTDSRYRAISEKPQITYQDLQYTLLRMELRTADRENLKRIVEDEKKHDPYFSEVCRRYGGSNVSEEQLQSYFGTTEPHVFEAQKLRSLTYLRNCVTTNKVN